MLFGSGYSKDVYGSDAKEFLRSSESKKSVPFGQRFLHYDQSSSRDETDVQQNRTSPKTFADLCGTTTIPSMPQAHDRHQLNLTGKQSSLSGPFKQSSALTRLPTHSTFPLTAGGPPHFFSNFFAPNAFIHHQHHNAAVPTSFTPFMQPIQHSKTCAKAQKMQIMRPFEEKQESISSSDAVSSKYVEKANA